MGTGKQAFLGIGSSSIPIGGVWRLVTLSVEYASFAIFPRLCCSFMVYALIVRSCLAGSEFHRDCLSVDTDLAYRGFVSFG